MNISNTPSGNTSPSSLEKKSIKDFTIKHTNRELTLHIIQYNPDLMKSLKNKSFIAVNNTPL